MNKRAKDIQPHWRPNFRIANTLPDIKVVRTGFIVNMVAGGLFMMAAVFVLQREYRAMVLGNSVEGLEQQIEAAEPDDKEFLRESRRFRDTARYAEELQLFFDTPFTASGVLAELARLRPEDLVFENMRYSEATVSRDGEDEETFVEYQIRVSGETRQLIVVNEFKNALQNSEYLDPQGFTVSVNESVENPDEETRIFPFDISINVTPDAATGEGGGDDA